MKLLVAASFLLPLVTLYSDPPIILPADDPEASESHRIIWSTDPGIRYELQESTDLSTWTTVDGFPSEAQALAQQHKFEADAPAKFFRVIELDEQGPEIVSKRPRDEAFAVRRFSEIRVELEDRTGIDLDSIVLEVGDHGSFTLGDPELSFEFQQSGGSAQGGAIFFDLGGDAALGDWGETVEAELTVADTLGNEAAYEWTFELEVDPKVVEDVFVFGSPDAVRAGQKVGAIPTRILTERTAGGPVRMSAGTDPWTLADVEEDRLLIEYTDDSGPVFSVGTYLANLTPATIDEMFYRKVLAVEDDPEERVLTLMTEEVGLEEIVEEGSVSLDSSDIFFIIGEDGVIQQARAFDAHVRLDPLGYSLDGWNFQLRSGGMDLVDIHAEELHWWLTPSLTTSLDIGLTGLRRFEAGVRGEVESGMIFDVDVLLAGVAAEIDLFSIPPETRPGFWVPLGSIGPIPVSAQVQFNLELTGSAEAGAHVNFRTGFRQEASAEFGIDYDRNREPAVEWPRDWSFRVKEEPFSAQVDGELSLNLDLKPSVSFLVYGLAGMKGEIVPGAGLVFATDAEEVLTGRLEAAVSLDFAPDGPALAWLDPVPTLSRTIWGPRQWHLFPDSQSLELVQHPQSVTVEEGETLILFAEAKGPATVHYQWYQNGLPLWGRSGSALLVSRVNSGAAGEYYVRASAGGQSENSEVARVTVRPAGVGPAPEGFALIPAGTYARGDHKNETESYMARSRPVHEVYVSAFYMAETPVTYAQWREVYDWALQNGYGFDNSGQRGSDADWNGLPDTPENNRHPVVRINWYDMVKWGNARSEMEGLTPVYYTNDARTTVYKTGRHDVTNAQVRWGADGYRLPTEAEWEKAARGGLHGKRWPWGDEAIDGTRANYWNSSGTNGTTVVGSYPANGYGLYDMAGNVWEVVWDWYDGGWYGKAGATEPDTRGPSSGSYRVFRGGSWWYSPEDCRVAYRSWGWPDFGWISDGFRLARTD